MTTYAIRGGEEGTRRLDGFRNVEVQEDYTRWSVPPPKALTQEGERLWVLLYRVTMWVF